MMALMPPVKGMTIHARHNKSNFTRCGIGSRGTQVANPNETNLGVFVTCMTCKRSLSAKWVKDNYDRADFIPVQMFIIQYG